MHAVSFQLARDPATNIDLRIPRETTMYRFALLLSVCAISIWPSVANARNEVFTFSTCRRRRLFDPRSRTGGGLLAVWRDLNVLRREIEGSAARSCSVE